MISLLILSMILVNCNNGNHSADQGKMNKTKEKNVINTNEIKIERFDQDILALRKDSLNTLYQLRNKYGYFLDSIFCKQIMKIWTPKDEYLINNILDFVNKGVIPLDLTLNRRTC